MAYIRIRHGWWDGLKWVVLQRTRCSYAGHSGSLWLQLSRPRWLFGMTRPLWRPLWLKHLGWPTRLFNWISCSLGLPERLSQPPEYPESCGLSGLSWSLPLELAWVGLHDSTYTYSYYLILSYNTPCFRQNPLKNHHGRLTQHRTELQANLWLPWHLWAPGLDVLHQNIVRKPGFWIVSILF